MNYGRFGNTQWQAVNFWRGTIPAAGLDVVGARFCLLLSFLSGFRLFLSLLAGLCR